MNSNQKKDPNYVKPMMMFFCMWSIEQELAINLVNRSSVQVSLILPNILFFVVYLCRSLSISFFLFFCLRRFLVVAINKRFSIFCVLTTLKSTEKTQKVMTQLIYSFVYCCHFSLISRLWDWFRFLFHINCPTYLHFTMKFSESKQFHSRYSHVWFYFNWWFVRLTWIDQHIK